jgi:chromosome partitioning protein
MGRRVDVDELVGATEIAERIGLAHPENVHSWRRRYEDFPEPVAVLRQGMVWCWADVKRWAKRTGRL